MAMRLHIASYGWQHPGWEGAFYPEDLPPEWRLDYYANEFQALVLPPEKWVEASPDDVRQWCAEAPDLTFFPLLPPLLGKRQAVSWAAVAENADAFQSALGGFLLPLAGSTDSAEIREAYAALDGDRPCCLMANAQPRGAMLRSELHAPLSLCIQADGELPQCTGGGLVVARVQGGDLRTLRRLIEALVCLARPDAEALLMFQGEPPDIQLMRQARTIAELLGYR